MAKQQTSLAQKFAVLIKKKRVIAIDLQIISLGLSLGVEGGEG